MKTKTIPELRRICIKGKESPGRRRAALVELIARAVNEATSGQHFATFFMGVDRKRADRFLRTGKIL